MSELSKKVEFLKGLAEGMNLTEDKPENKLLLKMLDVLGSMGEEISELKEKQDDIEEYLENLDEDLGALEDAVFEDDEDEDVCGENCSHRHLDAEEEEAMVEYECPNCGYTTKFDITDFDFEEDYLCPECHQPFFPEHEDDDDETDEKTDQEETER